MKQFYKKIISSAILFFCLLRVNAQWKMVSAGDTYTLAIKQDGSLWGWGDNSFGALGDGTYTTRTVPTEINCSGKWVLIEAAYDHNLGLKADGTLWAWGQNDGGQLGNGTVTWSDTIVQVGTGNDWQTAAVGDENSFAIKKDGTLWAWGSNSFALGDGTTIDRHVPTQIGTDNHWQSVSSVGTYTLATKTDGTLWAWGLGSLGNGIYTTAISPVQIGTDHNWKFVCAGNDFSLAIKTDGTLWAWGDNSFGQLGDGTYNDELVPIQVGTESDWASATSGITYSVATKTDGSLWDWGSDIGLFNQTGILGMGFNLTNPVLVPTRVNSGTDWLYPSARGIATTGFKKDGSLYAWGDDTYGQLGIGVDSFLHYPITDNDVFHNSTEAVPTKVLSPTQCAFNFNPFADTITTLGDSVVLNAGAGYTSYAWNNATSSPTNTIRQTGWYKVTVTNNSCCVSTDSVYVIFGHVVIQSIAVTICSGQQYKLPWGAIVTNAGNYTDTLKDSNGNDSVFKIVQVQVSDPVAAFVFTSVAGNPNIDFTNLSSNALSWAWDFGDGIGSTAEKDPSYNYTDTGTYSVRLIAANDNCSDTVYHDIVVTGLKDIYIPNAFSPNGDGLNDNFTVNAIGIQTIDMSIYNRWGELIFRTNNTPATWQGKDNKGVSCDEGVYVYSITLKDKDNRLKYYKGTVVLIR